MRGKESEFKGNLYCQNETTATKVAEDLVAKVIVFQGLGSRISSNASGLSGLYPFPRRDHIKKAFQITGTNGNIDTWIWSLGMMRKALVEQGLQNYFMPMNKM